MEASLNLNKAAPVSDQDYKKLLDRVKKLESRMRLQEVIFFLPFALIAGGGIGLAVALVSRILPAFTWEQVLIIALAALMVALGGTLGYALFRPRPLLQTARRADRALGLKDRLSTAIEGRLNPEGVNYRYLGARQFEDTNRSLEGLKTNKSFPLRLPKKPALAGLGLIPLLVLALVIPNPNSDVVKDRQEVQKQVQQEAQKIEQLKQQIEKTNPEAKNDPKLQELLKELEKAKQELLNKSDNREEAVASLQQIEQQLQKLNDPNQPAQKAAIEQLARSLQGSDLTKQAGQALSQNSPDRFDKAAEELSKAANNTDQLKKDPAQAQQLSDKLKNDAQNFKNSDPNLSQKLQQASDALKPDNLNQNPDAAKKSIQDLGKQLQQTGQDQKTQEQLQQAQAQLQKSEQSISQAGQQNKSGSQQNSPAGSSPTSLDNSPQSPDSAGDQQMGQDPSAGDQQSAEQQGSQGQPGQQGQPNQQGKGQQDPNGDGGTQPGQDGQPGTKGDQGQPGQPGSGEQPGLNGDQQKGSKAGTGHNDNFYPNPSLRTDQNGKQVNVNGKNADGPQNSKSVNGGQASGEAKVPLSDLIETYRNAASESLDKNYVPITLKDVIKKYFDDLNDGTGNGK